jgi:hypothetical protein
MSRNSIQMLSFAFASVSLLAAHVFAQNSIDIVVAEEMNEANHSQSDIVDIKSAFADTEHGSGVCSGCNSGYVTGNCYGSCIGFGSQLSLISGGLICPSDHAFDDFISPMTNPLFFEDPRNLTEARAIFANHRVPLAVGGGDIRVYALQLRARLSENVSLIATKDGYIDSSNPVINDGWADLAAGLKFNLLVDTCSQRLLSGGFTMALPTGEARAFQGNGDGELHLFLSGARKIGCRSHWLSAAGIRVPMNPTDESTSSYWSNHLDYQVSRGIYLFTEANWYHWLRSGRDGAINGIEGLDFFNLGSPGVAGNDIVTSSAGVKLKPGAHSEIGVAFEFPLTERRDVIDNRLTVDWIIRY